MGSFAGHVIPGSFFLIFAVWWTTQILYSYFSSMRVRAGPYVSKVMFPVTLGRRTIHMEAWLIAVLTFWGIIVEVVASPAFRGTDIVGATNTQHATMYTFFCALALLSILMARCPLLPNRLDIEYILLIMAFSVEAILFKFHLYGREDTNMLIHILLLYANFGCIASAILEMNSRRNVIFALLRAYFTLLQGTWFWQAAVFLYNPSSDPWGHFGHRHVGAENITMAANAHAAHEEMMMITCTFAWHMGGCFAFMLITGVLLFQCFRRRALNSKDIDFPLSEIPNSSVHYSQLHDNEEDMST